MIVPRSRFALHEWNRVLKQNGRLSLRVASLLDEFKLLYDPKWQSYEHQARLIRNLFGA